MNRAIFTSETGPKGCMRKKETDGETDFSRRIKIVGGRGIAATGLPLWNLLSEISHALSGS